MTNSEQSAWVWKLHLRAPKMGKHPFVWTVIGLGNLASNIIYLKQGADMWVIRSELRGSICNRVHEWCFCIPTTSEYNKVKQVWLQDVG